jgi:hypothetical protein
MLLAQVGRVRNPCSATVPLQAAPKKVLHLNMRLNLFDLHSSRPPMFSGSLTDCWRYSIIRSSAARTLRCRLANNPRAWACL